MSYVVVADADVVVAVLLLPGYRVCARPRASDADVGRKKEDAAAEVDRLTAEQERVRKELDQEVIKQKNEQHRKLQERLAKRKKKTSNVSSSTIT